MISSGFPLSYDMTGRIFPLMSVTVRQTTEASKVKDPSYSCDKWQVSESEFALQVPGVGNYYARDGEYVEYSDVPGADREWVNLYLYGQVLVALLHQRKIINFHASSFIYGGRGIMISGETGAGKSSLTASFALSGGAGFLSDDLTPVVFRESKPYIWPLYRGIKLREDTVLQLGISREKLKEAESGTGKQYLDVNRANVLDHPLHTVLKIETGDCHKVEFHEPALSEKFSLLRSEICSWEILAGMPDTEAAYMQQLVQIVEQIRIVRVVRPAEVEIAVLQKAVREYLGES